MQTPPVNMLKKERHAFILKQINIHNKVLSSDLSSLLSVSEDTVRRDLIELADTGKIIKVHGGALSKSFHFPFQHLEVYAHEAKKIIAHKTIKELKDGMVVLTGGGTTMIELARVIPEELEITFFTISPLVALELAEHPKVTVILIGGQFSKDAQINMGSKAVAELSEIKVDLCLLGANGIDVEQGITDSDWEVVQVKKAMLKTADKAAVLCISEKLNSIQKLKVCNLNHFQYLITDLEREDPLITPYASEIQVI